MRGKDIQPGVDYAVVKTRSHGCEDRAVRAQVEHEEQDGSWLVRFDEPHYVTYWSFSPASGEKPDYLDSSHPRAVSEFVLDSRHVLASWDDYLDSQAQKARAAAEAVVRQEQEQAMLTTQISGLRTLLRKRGLGLGDDDLVVSLRYVDKEKHSVGLLVLDAAQADALLSLLTGRKRDPRVDDSSLAGLALELEALVAELGYDVEDERLSIASAQLWRRSGYNHWLQAHLPPEVLGALVQRLEGERPAEDGALAALLSPLLG